LTVRELVVMRIERGPLGARQVSDTVEAAVRAACRMVHEREASEDLVETVCRACLDAVRGHGGESTRWLAEATGTVYVVLDDLARERADEPAWRWLARRMAVAFDVRTIDRSPELP
ncbi:MAG TPA: hypothetical protein VML54_11080, partial [Candidatus Limnocylindrales bacterium]|nr:hypothetical protein [Candidatus Limnocylindrales bacterium]